MEQIRRFIGRSGCVPCDRNEAGYQLGALSRKGEELKSVLSVLDGDN